MRGADYSCSSAASICRRARDLFSEVPAGSLPALLTTSAVELRSAAWCPSCALDATTGAHSACCGRVRERAMDRSVRRRFHRQSAGAIGLCVAMVRLYSRDPKSTRTRRAVSAWRGRRSVR